MSILKTSEVDNIMRNQTAQIRTHKFYEAYLRAQMRYLHKPTHTNWHRKEALLEAYQKALGTKNLS